MAVALRSELAAARAITELQVEPVLEPLAMPHYLAEPGPATVKLRLTD